MKVFKLMLVAAALAVTAPAVAQDLSFGVKAGLNFSKFTVEKDEDGDDYSSFQKSKPGISLGVYADYTLSDLLAIESGLQFDQKGSKAEGNDGGSWSEKYTINYFTIPINARVNLAMGDNNLYFLAGPTFGIGISGKNKYEEKGRSTDYKIKFEEPKLDEDGDPIDDGCYAKRMNVGLLLGAGYELSNNIGARLTYEIGLSNISQFSKGEVKTGVLGITVTYKF